MANRYDLVTPRAGRDGKTYYTKIGSMFENRNSGYSLTFDALPMPSLNNEGVLECRVLAFEPREREAPRGNGRQQAPASRDNLDDDVPF